eukprot:1164848-Alexandrium_andersonii.AAC.1
MVASGRPARTRLRTSSSSPGCSPGGRSPRRWATSQRARLTWSTTPRSWRARSHARKTGTSTGQHLT